MEEEYFGVQTIQILVLKWLITWFNCWSRLTLGHGKKFVEDCPYVNSGGVTLAAAEIDMLNAAVKFNLVLVIDIKQNTRCCRDLKKNCKWRTP